MTPPPRPPALDRPRADAALARLRVAVRACLAQLVAVPPPERGELPSEVIDTGIYAACRLLAWMVVDGPRAFARRDAAGLERLAREVEGFAGRLPKHLADLRTPGAWGQRGPIDVDLGLSRRRGGR